MRSCISCHGTLPGLPSPALLKCWSTSQSTLLPLFAIQSYLEVTKSKGTALLKVRQMRIKAMTPPLCATSHSKLPKYKVFLLKQCLVALRVISCWLTVPQPICILDAYKDSVYRHREKDLRHTTVHHIARNQAQIRQLLQCLTLHA